MRKLNTVYGGYYGTQTGNVFFQVASGLLSGLFNSRRSSERAFTLLLTKIQGQPLQQWSQSANNSKLNAV